MTNLGTLGGSLTFGTIEVVRSNQKGQFMISTRRMIRFALTLLLGASFAACAGDATSGPGSGDGTTPPPPQPQPPAANAVSVADNSFSPTPLTVSAGTTVTWTWAGGNSHNVTFDDGFGNSFTQTSGTHMRQFTAAGAFPYHCTIHGRAVMSGEIVAQ